MKRSLLCLIFGLMPALPALAQDQSSEAAPKWITAGTYALSNFNSNELREKSYWGANRENGRIASYLPGMTILYQAKKSEPDSKAYLIGITQSGIPVAVLASDISRSDFSQRSTRDVVFHFADVACKVSNCDDEDKIPVGSSFSFSIVSEDENEIVLSTPDELHVVYSRAEFDEKEVKGYLTRHKDRKYPRWGIHEGYAASLSAGCGEVIAKHTKVAVPAAKYEGDPSSWELNDEAWSVKAIEAFNLGTVQKQDSDYVGVIDGDIDGKEMAVDITVFAYRDIVISPEFYKFAGIVTKVACTKPGIGNPTPSFVKEAIVFFDQDTSRNTNQRLPQFDLTPQMSEQARGSIFKVVGRSLFYSINSPSQFEQVFGQISDQIKNPSAVSFIIARLNASCRAQDRRQCRTISKASP